MKPILWLNPDLQKTHQVPAHDPEGRKWRLFFRVVNDYHYHDAEFPERGVRAARWIRKFRAEWEWKEEPLIMRNVVLLGRNAWMRGYGKRVGEAIDEQAPLPTPPTPIQMPLESFETHPDNYDALSPETKEKWDARAHPGEWKFTEMEDRRLTLITKSIVEESA